MPPGQVEQLDEERFDESIRASAAPVLVHFWAGWCQPCKRVALSLNELAGEFQGRAAFARVDIDDSGDLANRFGVNHVPTLVLFLRGRVADQMVGAAPTEVIRALLQKHLVDGRG